MACHACGGTYEFFSQRQDPTYEVSAPLKFPKAPACPAKDMMSSCMYTSQGIFICNKGNVKEEGVNKYNVANNYDMSREVYRDYSKFNDSEPWGLTDKSQQILKLYP